MGFGLEINGTCPRQEKKVLGFFGAFQSSQEVKKRD